MIPTLFTGVVKGGNRSLCVSVGCCSCSSGSSETLTVCDCVREPDDTTRRSVLPLVGVTSTNSSVLLLLPDNRWWIDWKDACEMMRRHVTEPDSVSLLFSCLNIPGAGRLFLARTWAERWSAVIPHPSELGRPAAERPLCQFDRLQGAWRSQHNAILRWKSWVLSAWPSGLLRFHKYYNPQPPQQQWGLFFRNSGEPENSLVAHEGSLQVQFQNACLVQTGGRSFIWNHYSQHCFLFHSSTDFMSVYLWPLTSKSLCFSVSPGFLVSTCPQMMGQRLQRWWRWCFTNSLDGSVSFIHTGAVLHPSSVLKTVIQLVLKEEEPPKSCHLIIVIK